MSLIEPVTISPLQLLVRCFAERRNQQWQAFSLEFGLAAQADTLDEVRAKLDAMIASYLEDALVGEDRRHATYLLARRATFSVWLRYHIYAALRRIGTVRGESIGRVFSETLPLAPAPSAI